MPNQYMPGSDAARVPFLKNFAAKIGGYQPTFASAVAVADVTQVVADALMWEWLVTWADAMSKRAKEVIAHKKQLRDGPGIAVIAPPGGPSTTPPPASVPMDIFGRLGALIVRIKAHPAYTVAIGQDLGIIAPVSSPADPQSAQPILTLRLIAGGQVEVVWDRFVKAFLRIEVDRGTGFQFLAIDTIPNYTDTAPLPAAGQSAVWKYRAIYLLDDEMIGQWSTAACISVMGA